MSELRYVAVCDKGDCLKCYKCKNKDLQYKVDMLTRIIEGGIDVEWSKDTQCFLEFQYNIYLVQKNKNSY